MCNIYKITNKIDGRGYVGQTLRGINSRLVEHKHCAKNPKSLLHQSIHDEGIDKFVIEILEVCENEMKDIRESYWISYYNTTDITKGYNVSTGGAGSPGVVPSEETREKIRIKAKERGFTEEARLAHLVSVTGKPVAEHVAEANRQRGMKCAKVVMQYTPNMEFIAEYPSIIEASRVAHVDRRTIQRQLSGEYKLNNSMRSKCNVKFLWKYKTEDELKV